MIWGSTGISTGPLSVSTVRIPSACEGSGVPAEEAHASMIAEHISNPFSLLLLILTNTLSILPSGIYYQYLVWLN